MRKLFSCMFSLICFFAGVIFLSSCASVKPYQRENLADPIMRFDANAHESSMELHFLLTREGSFGGYGGAGGGCACN